MENPNFPASHPSCVLPLCALSHYHTPFNFLATQKEAGGGEDSGVGQHVSHLCALHSMLFSMLPACVQTPFCISADE